MPKLTRNGKPCEACDGERLIDVINRSGVELAQVCYHPQLGPIQTCDTCMVEINGELRRACGTTAADGMAVTTASARARAAQDLGEQLVEIVRGWRTLARGNLLGVGHVVQQAIVGVVEQFVFLSLLDGLNCDSELLTNLVKRIAEDIGNTGLDVDHSVDAAQTVSGAQILGDF